MNKTTKLFKITTLILSVIDIFAIVFFTISLTLAFSQKNILNTSHLTILIITIILNVLYSAYLVTYLITHKKR